MIQPMSRNVQAELDEAIFERIVHESERQGRPTHEVLGEAAERYLNGTAPSSDPVSVVARTWASIPFDTDRIRQILDQEPDFLDA
jgi:hypothetical protein